MDSLTENAPVIAADLPEDPEGITVGMNRNRFILLIQRNQKRSAAVIFQLLDIRIVIQLKDSNFAVIQRFLLVHIDHVIIMENRFHTVSAYRNGKISAFCLPGWHFNGCVII